MAETTNKPVIFLAFANDRDDTVGYLRNLPDGARRLRDVLQPAGLAAFLAQQQGLQLVFLNGCSTQQQTQGLLDANISAVISTSWAIDDQVATDFSCQFYQGLAGGVVFRKVCNKARAMV